MKQLYFFIFIFLATQNTFAQSLTSLKEIKLAQFKTDASFDYIVKATKCKKSTRSIIIEVWSHSQNTNPISSFEFSDDFGCNLQQKKSLGFWESIVETHEIPTFMAIKIRFATLAAKKPVVIIDFKGGHEHIVTSFHIYGLHKIKSRSYTKTPHRCTFFFQNCILKKEQVMIKSLQS